LHRPGGGDNRIAFVDRTPRTRARAWLFTILHNRYVNQVRRSVRDGKYRNLRGPSALARTETRSCRPKGKPHNCVLCSYRLPHTNRRGRLVRCRCGSARPANRGVASGGTGWVGRQIYREPSIGLPTAHARTEAANRNLPVDFRLSASAKARASPSTPSCPSSAATRTRQAGSRRVCCELLPIERATSNRGGKSSVRPSPPQPCRPWWRLAHQAVSRSLLWNPWRFDARSPNSTGQRVGRRSTTSTSKSSCR
jgi:hypothetical protein